MSWNPDILLTLDYSTLSVFKGDRIPPTAIAGPNPTDTFSLTAPPSPALAPVVLQVTAGGAGLQVFDAPLGTQRVDVVLYGRETYRPAADPADIQAGEFVFNSLTLQITLLPRTTLTAGRSLLVQAVDPGAVLTSYLLTAADALPDIFYKYNVTGALAWSCGWEESPSGQFELITDWATADALENELIPQETELEIYGVGFQVASLTITKRSPLENPNLEARVTVSLRGKWESYLEEQVVLDSPNGAAGGPRTIRGNTTVQAIAAKVGAVATLSSNTIKAPTKAGEEEILSLQDVFEGNLRHNGCFARYSSAGGIEAVPLDAVTTHQIAYTDLYNQALEIQINANPRAFDYQNGRLEWGESAVNSTFGEDTQGNRAELLAARWRQKFADKRIEPVGSPDPTAPPADLVNACDASMVFDSGGPTKELTITYTENGAIVAQEYVKFGIVAVACDDLYVRNVVSGKVVWSLANVSPGQLWQVVEQWKASYSYDQNGYLTAVNCTGQRLVRLKSESGAESCEAYDAWAKASTTPDATTGLSKKDKARRQLDFYRFEWRPIVEQAAYVTNKFRDRYSDIPPPPTEEAEIFLPEFNPDGTRANPIVLSSYGPVTTTREDVDGEPWLRVKYQTPVPGWVDPRFCTAEESKKGCFLSAPDPESTSKKPLPDLTTGEDKEVEIRRYVPDFRNQDRRGSYVAESYIEYSRLQTQKDASFARSARETSEQQSKGRPSEHTRKEKLYEKIDPTEGEPDPDEWEYIISTTEVDDDRLIGETASYPYASTFDQAITGLQTDLEINNTRDTKNTAIDLKHSLTIREGDLINLEGHGEWRVLGYSKSLAILAPGVIQPGTMNLELGKRIGGVQVAVTKRLKPTPPDDADEALSVQSVGLEGGTLFQGVTRGNR